MAFDYAKAYQQFIDEEFAAASATAWMIPEAGKVRFTGGRDIEISTLSTTGLGNYDAGKADGSAYPQGTVTNSWKSYTLSMDRGVKFSLDRTDPNDTGFLVTAENVIREFARNALVKEQDTYRDMKIVQEMYARGFDFTPIDVYRAKPDRFQVIDGKLMPALNTIDGMGDNAAIAVAEAAKDGKFLSKDDFRQRTKATKTVIDLMADLGLLGELPESNQLSLFDFA